MRSGASEHALASAGMRRILAKMATHANPDDAVSETKVDPAESSCSAQLSIGKDLCQHDKGPFFFKRLVS